MPDDYDRNSMFIWFPAVQAAGIPHPRTLMIELTKAEQRSLYSLLDGEPIDDEALRDRLIATAFRFGFPLFLRTDLSSGKHGWIDTCRVPSLSHFLPNLGGVIEYNEVADMIGLPWRGLALRELLDLDSSFRAFRDMPVAAERRYFVQDGVVLCHHPYWIEDAIEGYTAEPDWREKLALLNDESSDPPSLMAWAEKVSLALKGAAWSVDFARLRNGDWSLIDMARAERSWHPEHEGGGA